MIEVELLGGPQDGAVVWVPSTSRDWEVAMPRPVDLDLTPREPTLDGPFLRGVYSYAGVRTRNGRVVFMWRGWSS